MGCRVGGYDLGVMRHNLNVSLYVLNSSSLNLKINVSKDVGRIYTKVLRVVTLKVGGRVMGDLHFLFYIILII